jgi:A/G-specific adenine glycosylase
MTKEIVIMKKIFVSNLALWAKKHPQTYPWRTTDNPYDILIAEILLQKTKADQVSNTFVQFVKDYPNIESLVAANDSEIKEKIESLGLGNTRTRRIKKIALLIHCSFKNDLSEETFRQVLGKNSPYLLNALRCFAFGRPYPVFDVNVKRILERVFDIDFGKNAHRSDRGWQISEILVPKKNSKEYNWALLDLGRLVCISRNPKCPSCPLKNICKYSLKQYSTR